MPNEALTCLTNIVDEAPRWLLEFEQILEKSTRRQAELVTARQAAKHHPMISRLDSLSDFVDPLLVVSDGSPIAVGGTEDDTRPLIPHMTNSDVLRLSQRKRKTASVCSGDVSGPSKLRSRSKAIVYFDGDVQNSCERLVRALGSARNSIRKGKMCAKVDSLSRTGSSSSEASNSDAEDPWAYASKFQLINARLPRRPRPFAPDDGAEVFDKVDKCMAEAQSLCERAAHQMLRFGGCSLEVGKAKAHLIDAVTLIEAELPAMRKRAAKAEARRRRSDERTLAREPCEEVCIPAQTHVILVDAAFPAESALEVDDMKVDDDSDDDAYDFDAIPLGKFSQLRSTRRVLC